MDLVSFRLPSEADPDGSKLRAVIACHSAYERAKSLRQVFSFGIVVASLGLGARTLRPDLLSEASARLTVAAWGTCLLGALAAGTSEWRWRRRRARILDEIDRPLP